MTIATLILVACIVFGPLTSSAASLTSSSRDAAANVAHNWMRYTRDMNWTHASKALDDAAPALQEITYQGQLLGYVAADEQGYVIIPAYAELPPITAYSTESTFHMDDEGGFVQMLKEVMTNKIEVAQSVLNASQITPEIQPVRDQIEKDYRMWQNYSGSYDEFRNAARAEAASQNRLDDTQDYGPLCHTVWHQSAPFNNFCPIGSGGRTVVGCVATAMSQILAFWRSPVNGTGSHSYNWAGDTSCGSSTPGATLTAYFSDSYDWPNALDAYGSGYTQPQADAVAEISYETGVAVNMMYGHCGSGAYVPGPVITAFQSYFGMASGENTIRRNSYTAATWFQALQAELNLGHPMFYTIYSHAIVCDGWRVSVTNQLHFNYGWADGHTAWYTVDGLYCPWSGCSPSVEQAIRGIYPTNAPPPPPTTPTLAVGAPNGGESWASGTSHAITWTSSNLTESVKIELNRSYPSSTWELLTASTANSGSYNWAVSGTASATARIRITGTSHTTVGDTSNTNFAITSGSTSPTITVSSPNGGESWATGTSHAVTWTSSAFSGYVTIELKRAYPSGTWETVASNLSNTGSYNWAVSGAASTAARVRVRGATQPTVGDTSNANFSITSGSTNTYVTVLSPNGGELWSIYQYQYIRWTSSNAGSTVRIELNRSYPTGSWELITSSTSNSGTYLWYARGVTTTAARIRITSNTYPSATDVSNYNFTIRSGSYSNSDGADAAEPVTHLVADNYPNPFNPTTTIHYSIPMEGDVKVAIFDLTGRQVAELVNAHQTAGRYSVAWNGSQSASGTYFYRVTVGNKTFTNRMMLLK